MIQWTKGVSLTSCCVFFIYKIGYIWLKRIIKEVIEQKQRFKDYFVSMKRIHFKVLKYSKVEIFVRKSCSKPKSFSNRYTYLCFFAHWILNLMAKGYYKRFMYCYKLIRGRNYMFSSQHEYYISHNDHLIAEICNFELGKKCKPIH